MCSGYPCASGVESPTGRRTTPNKYIKREQFSSSPVPVNDIRDRESSKQKQVVVCFGGVIIIFWFGFPLFFFLFFFFIVCVCLRACVCVRVRALCLCSLLVVMLAFYQRLY